LDVGSCSGEEKVKATIADTEFLDITEAAGTG
jgi:hypothetical protein